MVIVSRHESWLAWLPCKVFLKNPKSEALNPYLGSLTLALVLNVRDAAGTKGVQTELNQDKLSYWPQSQSVAVDLC